eukprot:jgi/Botrbrau1/9212/Bobra.0028s0008.1
MQEKLSARCPSPINQPASTCLPPPAHPTTQVGAVQAGGTTDMCFDPCRYYRGYWPGLTGKWMIYFTAWGPFLVIEQLLLSALRKRGLAPPAWLSVPLTLLLGLTWSHLYFFPVMLESGIYNDGVRSFRVMRDAITGSIAADRTEL